MPGTPDPLKPFRISRRDREIYQQVVVQQLTQRQVANLHKLSQPRVSNIVHRVARWLSETVPDGFEEIPRPQRLYLTARTYQMKLEYYEQQAKRAFEQTQQESYVSTRELQEGADGKLTCSGPGKLQRKNPKPDVRLLLAAQKFALAQVEFDGFSAKGEVNMKNEGRLYEEPERGKAEALDELTRRALAWAAHRKLAVPEGLMEQAGERANQGDISSGSHQPVIKPLSEVYTDNTQSVAAKAVSAGAEKSPLLSRKSPHLAELVGGQGNMPAVKTAEPLSSEARPKIIPTPSVAAVHSRVANVEGVRRNFGTTPFGQGRVYLPENSPDPGHCQKESPPAPPGYHRVGDECRPIPTQSVKVNTNRRLPGMRISPPRAYWLDPQRNEWVPVA